MVSNFISATAGLLVRIESKPLGMDLETQVQNQAREEENISIP